MRNVPEKERHRLKEYSTEELTRDWEYRLAAEERDAALREYLDAVEKVENLRVDEYRAWAENELVSPEGRKELLDNTVREASAAARLADAEIKMMLLLNCHTATMTMPTAAALRPPSKPETIGFPLMKDRPFAIMTMIINEGITTPVVETRDPKKPRFLNPE